MANNGGMMDVSTKNITLRIARDGSINVSDVIEVIADND